MSKFLKTTAWLFLTILLGGIQIIYNVWLSWDDSKDLFEIFATECEKTIINNGVIFFCFGLVGSILLDALFNNGTTMNPALHSFSKVIMVTILLACSIQYSNNPDLLEKRKAEKEEWLMIKETVKSGRHLYILEKMPLCKLSLKSELGGRSLDNFVEVAKNKISLKDDKGLVVTFNMFKANIDQKIESIDREIRSTYKKIKLLLGFSLGIAFLFRLFS